MLRKKNQTSLAVSTKSKKFHTNDAQPDYEFESGIYVRLRRLAIRAAKFYF
jgi:hypothetical protein